MGVCRSLENCRSLKTLERSSRSLSAYISNKRQESMNTTNGLCECGCGGVAPLYTMTSNKRGRKKGEPARFIHGHNQKGKISGKNNPMWGRCASDKTRAKMSKSQTGRKASEETRLKQSVARRGEKSHFWKGGIASENERARKNYQYREWREKVFERDNWTCQKCNKRGGILHPHHIKSFSEYPELRYEIFNGITLCANPCHLEEEHWGMK